MPCFIVGKGHYIFFYPKVNEGIRRASRIFGFGEYAGSSRLLSFNLFGDPIEHDKKKYCVRFRFSLGSTYLPTYYDVDC